MRTVPPVGRPLITRNQKTQKAVKDHTCTLCGRLIPTGDYYVNLAIVSYSKDMPPVYGYRYHCQNCVSIDAEAPTPRPDDKELYRRQQKFFDAIYGDRT